MSPGKMGEKPENFKRLPNFTQCLLVIRLKVVAKIEKLSIIKYS